MARWKHAAATLEAARRWKQLCLPEGSSVFADEDLWTRSNLEQLHASDTRVRNSCLEGRSRELVRHQIWVGGTRLERLYRDYG